MISQFHSVNTSSVQCPDDGPRSLGIVDVQYKLVLMDIDKENWILSDATVRYDLKFYVDM